MPLIVDLIGPLGFGMDDNNHVVDVWLAECDPQNDQHEAAISTPVTALKLSKGDYQFTGPERFMGPTPRAHPTGGCKVYTANGKPDPNGSAKNRFIRLTLPMPEHIVALNGVYTFVYPADSPPQATPRCDLYATGLRFLYRQAGIRTLTPHVVGLPNTGVIPFDPSDDETVLTMLIGYAPINHDDPNKHQKAKVMFHALSQLFPGSASSTTLNLAVYFGADNDCSCDRTVLDNRTGPFNNCKAPIISS